MSQSDSPSKTPPSATTLVEGRDYILENGLFVLTREYLLQRGHCCQSGCRNCPYGFSGSPAKHSGKDE